ncbi:glutathione S-transferase [Pelagibacterium lentulum]|uniref:GST N-terminal domain-containing protein n=1 Tax=Pelagibacterium lentulum TaxID=2029865 RepID=A0A916VXA3_9HYPH|nr:glutathione S-transferase [Pelagibacterium lentulum]GGA47966.1 hypothetical protein GCM10011499_17280 [Pelagibacterium lentulum]
MRMSRVSRPIIYHIPICPFSQRIEILLALKGAEEQVDFFVVDVTVPRPDWLLRLSRGRTSMPLAVMPDGRVISESLDILEWFDFEIGEGPIARRDAAELALIALAEGFTDAGYALILNQDWSKRSDLVTALLDRYAELDDVLNACSPVGPFLGQRFGFVEAVFAPIFQRFAFLEYYENFALPATSRYSRVARWQDACKAYPMAQQVTREEIVKLYYDYSKGAPNGALPPGRCRSSFSFLPHWSERPWPPREKYSYAATDAVLGLVCTDIEPVARF